MAVYDKKHGSICRLKNRLKNKWNDERILSLSLSEIIEVNVNSRCEIPLKPCLFFGTNNYPISSCNFLHLVSIHKHAYRSVKMNDEERTIHVEVCQRVDSTLSKQAIETAVDSKLKSMKEMIIGVIFNAEDLIKHKNTSDQTKENDLKMYDQVIKQHVESIICYNKQLHTITTKRKLKIDKSILKYYIYRLVCEDGAIETMKSDSDELPVMSHWMLPAKEFHYMWDNLYYDGGIKSNLLRFVETAMLFSDLAVNSNIINWNKLVLLYGPPGTGKTSLCKALAQKAAIRLGNRFEYGEFIEINSHSLFSKWFSESGKLVMKLFDEIRNMVQNENALVCILIDEIESLAHARNLCSNGTEPSDSIRVVNALLTQLDQIKRYPNVLILTTSNMTQAIDEAFVNRADIKQYLGYPSEHTIYSIYESCLEELMRVGILEDENLVNMWIVMNYENSEEDVKKALLETICMKDKDAENGLKLLQLSRKSKDLKLSGRILRKIPFLAHALLISLKKITLAEFLEAMESAIVQQKLENFTIDT